MKKSTPGPSTPKTSPSVDLFSAAPIDPMSKVKKKAKTAERERISFGSDLDKLAAIKTLAEALEGLGDQLEGELKVRARGVYAEDATTSKSHPSSFIAEGEVSSASVEMRKKASNQPLGEQILPVLEGFKIPFEKKVKVEARYTFDDQLLSNPEVRKAVSEALSSHPVLKTIAPNLVKFQPEQFTYVVTDNTLEMAAKNLTKEQYMEIISEISTLALGKWHLNGANIKSEKTVTNAAKSLAIGMLQEMGVLPASETPKKKKA